MSGTTFPISRDPPEGGTSYEPTGISPGYFRFQFLGIPPKGELGREIAQFQGLGHECFQFLGIPPKGEPISYDAVGLNKASARQFPISRDPPEGGTSLEERG